MSKIILNLNPRQIEEMIDRLPLAQKIRLAKKLEQQTWGKRLEQIFRKIDQRRKKHPISQKEIQNEINTVRQNLYGPRRH